MAFCARCGHDLADAPACARCGAPAVRLTSLGAAAHTSPRLAATSAGDTAERPAVVTSAEEVVVPSPSPEPIPSNARFPLFADEVAAPRLPVGPPVGPTSVPAAGPAPVPGRHRSTGDLLPWVLLTTAAVGLLLVAAIWLVLRPGGEAAESGSTPTGATAAEADPDQEGEGSPGAGDNGEEASAGPRARDVARSATALVPATAPANVDVNGRRVSYTADQMFDGDPTTAWRMPGDGTDALIAIRLDAPTEVSRVGMINGYAKQATDGQGRTIRWYLRNRRITAVSWSFDDGSVVRQTLAARPRMQTVRIDPEVTRTIRLRLLDVTGPMPGRLGRDFTAISEISIRGLPAR